MNHFNVAADPRSLEIICQLVRNFSNWRKIISVIFASKCRLCFNYPFVAQSICTMSWLGCLINRPRGCASGQCCTVICGHLYSCQYQRAGIYAISIRPSSYIFLAFIHLAAGWMMEPIVDDNCQQLEYWVVDRVYNRVYTISDRHSYGRDIFALPEETSPHHTEQFKSIAPLAI